MKIISSTLFLRLVVVLDFIELISSRVSLDVLFPGYNGVLPYLQEYRGNIHNFENLKSYNGRRNQFHPDTVFFRRKNVIVGSLMHNHIDPPFTPIGPVDKYVVFNISHTAADSHWVELAKIDFMKLGPFRLLSLVEARDTIVHRVVAESKYQGNLRAQKLACIKANAAADEAEILQLENLRARIVKIPKIIEIVGLEFNAVYQKTYRRITDPNRASSSGSVPSQEDDE